MNNKNVIVLLMGVIVLSGFVVMAFQDDNPGRTTEHFRIIAHGSVDPEAIRVLAETLESNYTRIGNDLKTEPAAQIEVNVYGARWRYILATGHWTASGNIEGIAKLHFVDQAWSESDSRKVALHEFTHTVVLRLLIDRESQPLDAKAFDAKVSRYPVWLWEAVCVYEAGQYIDPKTLPYMQNGSYPSLTELSDRSKGGRIYETGYTIIEYILDRFGRDALIDLIVHYGDTQRVLKVSEKEFSRQWYDHLQSKPRQ